MEVTVRWGDGLSENKHTSQDELPPMVKAWGWNGGLFQLDWQIREGFLGVVMLQLRSQGSEEGSLVEGEKQVGQGVGRVPGSKRRQQT